MLEYWISNLFLIYYTNGSTKNPVLDRSQESSRFIYLQHFVSKGPGISKCWDVEDPAAAETQMCENVLIRQRKFLPAVYLDCQP